MRKVDDYRYKQLLDLYNEGLLTPELEIELDQIEAVMRGTEVDEEKTPRN